MGAEGGAWVAFPEGYSRFIVVCLRHRGRVLVRRGAAVKLADGWVDVVFEPRDGEPAATGVHHADGGTTFVLRCPRCGFAPQVRQEKMARLLEGLAGLGSSRFDAKGRLVVDLALLP